jgi:predicted dehydrogenase
VRAAVIGCGAISQEHLGYLQTSHVARAVAACDRSPAAARHAQLRFGLDEVFTEPAEMLDRTAPDVVHILTPPATHAELVTLCMDAGAHVFCEKPIVLRAEDLDAIDADAERTGRLYMENHNHLRNDEVVFLEQVVAEGRIGEVRGVDISFFVPMPDSDLSAPGGAVHDFLTHVAYLTLRFLGDGQIDHVSSVWSLEGPKAELVYDEMVAIVKAGPRTATIRVSGTARPMENRITLAGTDGRATVELFQGEHRVDSHDPSDPLRPLIGRVSAGAGLLLGTVGSLRAKLVQHGAIHGLPRLLDEFYVALRDGAPLPVSRHDMRRTARLIDALLAGRS